MLIGIAASFRTDSNTLNSYIQIQQTLGQCQHKYQKVKLQFLSQFWPIFSGPQARSLALMMEFVLSRDQQTHTTQINLVATRGLRCLITKMVFRHLAVDRISVPSAGNWSHLFIRAKFAL